MREFKMIFTIETDGKTIEYERYYLIFEDVYYMAANNMYELLKADLTKRFPEIAEKYNISGDFTLKMTIEKNGEYYDSDEAAANYTNGVLTIEA